MILNIHKLYKHFEASLDEIVIYLSQSHVLSLLSSLPHFIWMCPNISSFSHISKSSFFLKLRKKHFKQKSENGTCESITLEKSVYMHFAILNRKLVDEWIDCNLPTKAKKNSLVVTLVSFLLLWENTKTKSSTEDKEPLYFRFPFSTQRNTYLSKTHIQSRAEKNESLLLWSFILQNSLWNGAIHMLSPPTSINNHEFPTDLPTGQPDQSNFMIETILCPDDFTLYWSNSKN